jgi:hypothetical protein
MTEADNYPVSHDNDPLELDTAELVVYVEVRSAGVETRTGASSWKRLGQLVSQIILGQEDDPTFEMGREISVTPSKLDRSVQ